MQRAAAFAEASGSDAAWKTLALRWAWKNGGRIFTATTLWLFPGDRAGALRNFIDRRPEAVSARVVEECL